MQNTTEKIWFAEKAGLDPQKMVTVCVTPCTAKKAEIKRKELNHNFNIVDGVPTIILVVGVNGVGKTTSIFLLFAL